jgi:hypothetical protein
VAMMTAADATGQRNLGMGAMPSIGPWYRRVAQRDAGAAPILRRYRPLGLGQSVGVWAWASPSVAPSSRPSWASVGGRGRWPRGDVRVLRSLFR